MRDIPPPPPCSRCAGAVGLWEPIVVHDRPDDEGRPRERTSWLSLARSGALPEAIAHWECPVELRPPRPAEG